MDDYAALWRDVPVYGLRTPRDFLPLFQSKPMQFTPGDHFHYNNAGFILLALVVEHISGLPFISFVTEHVFRAAGMADAGYFATDQLPPNTAFGYIDDEAGGARTNIFAVPVIGGGDGGAYVTAADTLALWHSIMDDSFLEPPLREAFLKPHMHEDESTSYGYGIWITHLPHGGQKYVMSGGDPGVTFYTACYPQHDVRLVAAANTSRGAGAMGRVIERCIEPAML